MGVYLSEPKTEKSIHSEKKGNLAFVSGEMQGWRKNMEDAAIHTFDIGDGNALFAVFDGHGGTEVSIYVSEIMVNVLKGLPQYGKKEYVKALDLTFKIIDQMIDSPKGTQRLKQIRKLKGNSNEVETGELICNGTGCTANVLLMTPEKYIVANSGDSRSALCRDGKNVVLSQDHKPESQIQESRITKAGGVIQMGRVNGGLNLSRSFGDFNYKRNKNLSYAEQMITCKPDIVEVARQSSDQFIIMGCDGIWERFVDNSQGLLDILKSQFKLNKEMKKIVEDLLNMLLAKDTQEGIGCDNMTAILIKLK